MGAKKSRRGDDAGKGGAGVLARLLWLGLNLERPFDLCGFLCGSLLCHTAQSRKLFGGGKDGPINRTIDGMGCSTGGSCAVAE